MKLNMLTERRMIIDVSFVSSLLQDYKSDIDDERSLTSLCRLLTSAFEDHQIRFRPVDDRTSTYGQDSGSSVGIVGAETSTDGRIAVDVSFDFKRAIQDEELYNRVVKYLTSIIRHELTHRYQLSVSNARMHDQNPKKSISKKGEWEQYYSDPHEIYAMAQEIIEQLAQTGLTPADIITLVQQTNNRELMKRSPRFADMYDVLTADGDPEQMLPRVRKLIYQALT